LKRWVHVAVTYDGSSRAGGIRIYVDGQAGPLEVVRDGLWKDITYDGGEPDLALGFRFRDHGFQGGRVDELRVYNRPFTPLEVGHLAGRSDLTEAWKRPASALSKEQREGLFEYFLANVDPAARQQVAELHALRQEQSRLVNPISEAMVMKEMPRPKP